MSLYLERLVSQPLQRSYGRRSGYFRRCSCRSGRHFQLLCPPSERAWGASPNLRENCTPLRGLFEKLFRRFSTLLEIWRLERQLAMGAERRDYYPIRLARVELVMRLVPQCHPSFNKLEDCTLLCLLPSNAAIKMKVILKSTQHPAQRDVG